MRDVVNSRHGDKELRDINEGREGISNSFRARGSITPWE